MSDRIAVKLKAVNKPHWIDYTASDKIIRELDQLLEFDHNHRPENILILSETNNGKTIIAKRFLNRHEPRIIFLEDGQEKIVVDVLMIQCPHVADEKLLYFSILDSMNVAYKSSRTKQELLIKVIDVFKRMHLKVLILDELQHLLSKSTKQRDMLNLLKYISNETGVSFVGIGTLEAFYVINSDSQLANRFNKTFLPKWKYDNEFLSLLGTLQSFIDLDNEFNIVTPKISRLIYDLGEGLLGEYTRIVKLLWKEAIESREEKIDIDTFKRINYTSPSKRRDDSFIYD